MGKRTAGYVEIDKKLYARIDYRDSSGKRKQKTKRVVDEDGIPTNEKRFVPAIVRQLWAEVEAIPENLNKDTTLAQYLDEWLNLTSEKRNEKTNSDYEGFFRLYVKPAIGNLPLIKVGAMDIQRVYKAMSDRGLSPKTVRLTHGALSVALKQAVKWKKIRETPAAGVDLPKRAHREMMFLDDKQAKKFLEVCKEDKHGLLFDLAIYTGARPSEYLGLKWQDIDFDRGLLRIQRKVRHNSKGGGWYEGETKTKQSKRSMPLDESLLASLRKHRIKQSKGGQMQTFVFASEAGTPLSLRNLERRHFKPLLKKAGLPDIRLYDLRHTCATLLLMKGTDIKTVSEWLGHANPDETLRTYAHVLPSMKEQAAKNIAEVLRG